MTVLAVRFRCVVVTTVPHLVENVRSPGVVPKVLDPVVTGVAVLVANFHSDGARTEERFCDEPVHAAHLSISPAVAVV
nr:hypothetical protein [Rhodococcus aetherivorans]